MFTARDVAHMDSTTSREPYEYYDSPLDMALGLLTVLPLPAGTGVWECACGSGGISRVLEAAGLLVLSTDIEDHNYGLSGWDFLAWPALPTLPWIITNPPFSLAEEFMIKAYECSMDGFALFLKSRYMEGLKRSKLLEKLGLNGFYVYEYRVPFLVGSKPRNLISFAWYIFDKHRTTRTFGWIRRDDVQRLRSKLCL